VNRLARWMGPWPGRLESAGHVKRRMLVIAVVAGLSIGGVYAVTQFGPETGPFTGAELRDMSGLPQPPVRFVVDADGNYHELTAEELQQLEELQRFIDSIPAQNFGAGVTLPQAEVPAADDGGEG
jgi:hypothetical protein